MRLDRQTIFAIVAMFLFAAWPAKADYTASQLLQTEEDWSFGYINGLFDGIDWINVEIGKKDKKGVYCIPPNLAVTTSQARSILQQQVRGDPRMGDLPAGFVLLRGLKDAFPCPVR